MRKDQVRTPEQALVYLIDCQLATVMNLAMKKSRGKHDFERQILIAQIGIDWAVQMGVDLPAHGTCYATEALGVGSVKKWAEFFMPEML